MYKFVATRRAQNTDLTAKESPVLQCKVRGICFLSKRRRRIPGLMQGASIQTNIIFGQRLVKDQMVDARLALAEV